jgi:hypothetical protein
VSFNLFVDALYSSCYSKLTYSNAGQLRSDHTFSSELEIALAPVLRFKLLPNTYLNPFYFNLLYSNTTRPLEIEDGKFLAERILDIYLLTGITTQIANLCRLKFQVFYTESMERESSDSSGCPLWKGTYNYRDIGTALEFGKPKRFLPNIDLRLGLKFLQRIYPNYTTPDYYAQYYPQYYEYLYDIYYNGWKQYIGEYFENEEELVEAVKEKASQEADRQLKTMLAGMQKAGSRELDTFILRPYFRFKYILPWEGQISLFAELKKSLYRDCRVVLVNKGSNGRLSSVKRQDKDFRIKLGVSKPLEFAKFIELLEYEFRFRNSNQNFYFTNFSPFWDEHLGLADYYDFLQNRFSTKVGTNLFWKLFGALEIVYEVKSYLKRPYRDKDGSFLDKSGVLNPSRQDKELLARLKFTLPLFKNKLRLEIIGEYLKNWSNMEYYDQYITDYTLASSFLRIVLEY